MREGVAKMHGKTTKFVDDVVGAVRLAPPLPKV